MRSKRFLSIVTGEAEFIGSELVAQLLTTMDSEKWIIDNFSCATQSIDFLKNEKRLHVLRT
jgi:UDP-glucose 4-epimerase